MNKLNAVGDRLGRVEEWLRRSDDGNNLVEYLLLVALIAIVGILAISFLGDSVSSQFSSTGASMSR